MSNFGSAQLSHDGKSSVLQGECQPEGQPAADDAEANRTMTIGQLVMFTFLAAAAGPYGSEPIVANGGPLLAILGFLIVPWLFSFPLSMVTAELATAMPEDGGIVRFVDRVMPRVFAFLAGYIALMGGCLTNAADTIILLQYLGTVAPVVAVGEAGSYAVIGAVYAFVLVLNVLGISSIGPFSKWLSACILIPFAVMFFISLRHASETGFLLGTISPVLNREGTEEGYKSALNGFTGALVLNTMGFYLPAACAGSVQNVKTTFPRGMLIALILVIFNFTIPILTGVLASQYRDGLWGCGPFPNAVQEGINVDDYQWSVKDCSPEFEDLTLEAALIAKDRCNQCNGGKWSHWQTGYYSVVAYLIGGKPLQWIVVIVAVIGSVGTILSGMCCNAYSVKVMTHSNCVSQPPSRLQVQPSTTTALCSGNSRSFSLNL
jgi:amino acid transporter